MKGEVAVPISFPSENKQEKKRIDEEAQGNEGPPSSRSLIFSQESGAAFSYLIGVREGYGK